MSQNPKELESLFWLLFNVEDEDALHKIVRSNPFLQDENNWQPYGGTRGNFGTFENQQPHPIPALVEKITNSIDSLLLKKCREAGIDPKSSEAPKDMTEAVEKYFSIKQGNFVEMLSPSERRNLAEEIQIVATGDKARPNITIYDNGEGQHPDDFVNTFLSLHNNNKTDIHFVQGKYNMGSTGAVVFCGNHRYQLIASKLSDKLNIPKRINGLGFTLVRRHPLTGSQEDHYRTSWYEYFAPNNAIPRFPITDIDLGLNERKFSTGSIVRLYSYQLPRGSRSDISIDLWRELNQYLYQPALPLLLVERRFGDSQKHGTKLLLGNKTRIALDEREKKEKVITLEIRKDEIGTVAIEISVFRHGVNQREFIGDKAIVFTVNGQVHGSLARSFISQELGLAMLRDYLLVQVDCTNIRTQFRQDLFMANRHNLKHSESFEKLQDKIIEVIKANDDLRHINQLRKDKILRDNSADDELLKNLLQAIPLDKDLLNLLKQNGRLDFLKPSHDHVHDEAKHHEREKEKGPKTSKRLPSIFKINLKEDKDGKRVKSIPLNGKGVIEFETDVEDEYLFRPYEKGEFQIQILGYQPNDTEGGTKPGKPKKVEDVFDVTVTGPTDNSIKITFEPKETLSVGDSVDLNARLTSPDGDLESMFYVRIVDPQRKQEDKKKDTPKPPALPKPIRVYEKQFEGSDATWEDFSWGGEDVVKVIPAPHSQELVIDAIAVNLDSFVLTRYISKQKISNEQGLKYTKDKFFASIYLHTLFLYGTLDKMNKSEEEQKFDLEELIPNLMKGYSSFLMYANTDDAILSNLKGE